MIFSLWAFAPRIRISVLSLLSSKKLWVSSAYWWKLMFCFLKGHPLEEANTNSIIIRMDPWGTWYIKSAGCVVASGNISKVFYFLLFSNKGQAMTVSSEQGKVPVCREQVHLLRGNYKCIGWEWDRGDSRDKNFIKNFWVNCGKMHETIMKHTPIQWSLILAMLTVILVLRMLAYCTVLAYRPSMLQCYYTMICLFNYILVQPNLCCFPLCCLVVQCSCRKS